MMRRLTIRRGVTVALLLFLLQVASSDRIDVADNGMKDHTSSRGRIDASDGNNQSQRYLFRHPQTEPFLVESANIPNITWDLGENYAGLIPITPFANETRRLFFWFFPTIHQQPKKEIIIWLNGGPGCSSMQGFLQGNGPINWLPGQEQPSPNPYTWVNLTNVIWVDQPVSVGFSQGEVDIFDEFDLGREFVGFWKNFAEIFGLEGYKVYFAGESYAGMYIPYIANAFLDEEDSTYFDVAGVAINDAFFADSTLQMGVPLLPFVDHWKETLNLNATFVEHVQEQAEECGLPQYLGKYLTFPPQREVYPELEYASNNTREVTCDSLQLDILTAVQLVNPCFSWYKVTEICPALWNVLGPLSEATPANESPFFNNPDLQRAVHVPVWTCWVQCKTAVFRNRSTGAIIQGDQNSEVPAWNGIMQRIIEHTNDFILGSGNLDMLLPTNGTLLALQNLTWNGHQGFQHFPSKELYAPPLHNVDGTLKASTGTLGTWTVERNLTFFQVENAGHMLLLYAPSVMFRVAEYLLGRVPALDDTVPEFTT